MNAGTQNGEVRWCVQQCRRDEDFDRLHLLVGPARESGLRVRADLTIWSLNVTESMGRDSQKAGFSIIEGKIEI